MDKNSISDHILKKLEIYTTSDMFHPDFVAKCSMAAAQISHWIMCVVEYAKMQRLNGGLQQVEEEPRRSAKSPTRSPGKSPRKSDYSGVKSKVK